MIEPYKIKLKKPQMIPALDNCFLVADTIEILPMSLFVNYYGKMYELYNGELIEKDERQCMQVEQDINCVFDAEEEE